VTGFGLYAGMSRGWRPQRFAWIVPLTGGDFALRQWHHVMMWFLEVFAMIHVYLVFYHDYVEGRGVISIAAVQPMEMALSPAIAAAVVPACAVVRDLLSSLTAGPREPNV
jgi:hypothetical protein